MSRSRRKKSGVYPCGSKDCGWCRKDELKRAQRQTAETEMQREKEAYDELTRETQETGGYDE